MFRTIPLCLLGFAFISFNMASAAERPIVATVLRIRGTVTKLLPGALEASEVLVDDKFPKDTSIVTGPKSFIKIKFVDNSELNMGPESKIVISEMAVDSPGIISLLKGRIRTAVQKTSDPIKKDKNKFYIRTRTAAMGVRGTDFQTIYNPDNHVTSLLTYKGAVAMAKIDDKAQTNLEKSNTEVIRDNDNSIREVKIIPGKQLGEKEEITNALSYGHTVIVSPGQNSFTSDALIKSSEPVSISEMQLNALYKNTDFKEKNILNLNSGIDLKNQKIELQTVAQKAPLEGFYNKKTGEYAPKSGGFIDQNTGLYIARLADNSGDFDADTGDYFAPKGLVLDAKKGFILDKNADVKPELLALQEDMNKSIARDRVVGNLDGEVKLAAKSLREKFIRNQLAFSLGFGNQDLKMKSSGRDVQASGVPKINVLLQFASINRFAALLGFNYSSVGYKDLLISGDQQDSKSLFTLSTGLKYALTNRVDLVSFLSLDQGHYGGKKGVSPDTYFFKRVVLTKLSLGADVLVAKSNNFSLMGNLYGTLGFRKKYNDLVIKEISEFTFRLTPQYAIDERKTIGIGFFLKKENSNNINSFGMNEQQRDDHGVELKYMIEL
jgi:hypothetical protein